MARIYNFVRIDEFSRSLNFALNHEKFYFDLCTSVSERWFARYTGPEKAP